MMPVILLLAALCAMSAGAVFGHVVPMASSLSGFFLVVFALSATLLIGSVEAYETQGVRIDRDDG